MMIERRDFVDFGHRQLHLLRERDDVRRGKASEAVLNHVQVFDQQIPAAGGVPEESKHVLTRFRIDATALRPALVR